MKNVDALGADGTGSRICFKKGPADELDIEDCFNEGLLVTVSRNKRR